MQSPDNKKVIILSGGGTGGSVTPLIAIAEDLEKKNPGKFVFHWVGTESGIEHRMTSAYPFRYHAIAAGKLRRYFSLQNILDIFNILIGFFQSIAILAHTKPQLVMSAGGFVSVPLIWAARLFDIPTLVHQQDIRPGLANKLMARCATIITTVFEKSVADYGAKAQWVGNPMRTELMNLSTAPHARLSLLALGGGTGSQAINTLITSNLDSLLASVDIIHITGKHDVKSALREDMPGYQSYDLLDSVHMAKAMAGADIVVTRAGLGTLSELSYLGKATIIIPIPDSHQEDNAQFFAERGAAIVLNQKELHGEAFVSIIQQLAADTARREELGQKMRESMKHDANEIMLSIIKKLVEKAD